jgi:hypothetical protein
VYHQDLLQFFLLVIYFSVEENEEQMHAARMRAKRNTYRVLYGTPEGNSMGVHVLD